MKKVVILTSALGSVARCFGGHYSKIPCEKKDFLTTAGSANLQVALGGEISVFVEYKIYLSKMKKCLVQHGRRHLQANIRKCLC